MSLLATSFYRPSVRHARQRNGGWNPWEVFENLFDNSPATLDGDAGDAKTAVFAPPVEVVHDRDEILVYAELPGVKREDIEITVQDNALTIKGAKKSQVERKEDRYQYVERRFGEFFRTFQLPAFVDAGKVKADYADGVLKIHMPVSEQARPRRVEIDMKN